MRSLETTRAQAQNETRELLSKFREIGSKLKSVPIRTTSELDSPPGNGNGPARGTSPELNANEPTPSPARANGQESAPKAGKAKNGRRLRQIFWAHLLRVKWRLAVAGLCTLGVAAADLLKPWPLKIVLDHGILDKPLPEYLAFLPGLLGESKVTLVAAVAATVVLIALCSGLFSYSQAFITSSLGFKMVYAVRREIFAHLQRLSLSFHTRARSGDLLIRIGGDTNTLKDIFAESILKLSAHLLTVIGMVGIMSALNWKVALVAVATLPVLGYSMFHRYCKTKQSVKSQRAREGQAVSRMGEVLSAMPLVQAFSREKYEEETLDQITAQTMKQSIRIARFQAAA